MLATSEHVTDFLDRHDADLEAAIARAESQGSPKGSVSVSQLKAAIQAFLGPQGFEGAELEQQWSLRTAVHPDRGDSILSDLVLSLACEQSEAYRGGPVDAEAAQAAYGAVYMLHFDALVAFVRSKVHEVADEAVDIAMESFSRVFLAYWSPSPSSRIRGASRLRTLFCTVARRLAVATLKAREAAGGDESVSFDEAEDTSASSTGEEAQEVVTAIRECLELLPPKRKIVAWQHWVDDRRASSIAEELEVGRPAVSNHLNRARPVLQECLQGKGVAATLG